MGLREHGQPRAWSGGRKARRTEERELVELFDEDVDLGERDTTARGDVELLMVVARESGKAWLLRPAGRNDLEPKWAPKSALTRAEPPDDDVFTMPKWIAKERGWL
jgi:hypothetical protein